MAKRRSSELELCFDSMTDLITNLAGGLILLVLLLLGVTREAPARQPDGDKAKAGPVPIIDLEKRAAMLTLAIKQADMRLADIDQKMKKLSDEAAELIGKVGAPAPPKPGKDAEDKKGATEVEYRLPLDRRVTKPALICFVKEGKLSFADSRALDDAEDALKAKAPQGKLAYPATIVPNRGDYDQVLLSGIEQEFKMKADAAGVAIEDAEKDGSRFREAMGRHPPSRYVIMLVVFPDSYEEMVKVRRLAWKMGYDVGWIPQRPAQPLRFGVGTNVVG